MMAIWLCWLTCFSVLRVGKAETNLGKGFFLPDEEIDNPKPGQARNVLKLLTDSCFDTDDTDDSITANDKTLFSNTESFYKSLSTDSSLSVELKGIYTMGTTLNIKTNNLSGGKVKVMGISINRRSLVRTAILNTECNIGSEVTFTDDLIKSLKALPYVVKEPENPLSWRRYELFFKNYGSHIVTQVYYGSSIKQWAFVREDSKYSQEQLVIKACAYFGGPSFLRKLGSIKACSGVTKEQVKAVSSLEMSNKLEIRGGSDETRNQLATNRTDELITKLLNEAREHDTAIKYQYTPIWEILQSKYEHDPELFDTSVRLQQYYMGFKEFGCSLIKKGKYKLRRFQLQGNGVDYECVLERQGCHSDTDCHDSSGFQSHCYGPGCVEYLSALDGSKAERARIRSIKTGGDSEGINQSCKYQKKNQSGSTEGKCNLQRFEDLVIWNGVHRVPFTFPTSTYRPMSGAANIKLGQLWCLINIICLSSTPFFQS